MNGAAMLPEFDHEIANTRKMLALAPNECLDYRPHAKSWTLRELASHVANLPTKVRRPGSLHHAERRRIPQFRPEPHHPSPRPTRRLPAHVRHCDPGHVRPLRRRNDVEDTLIKAGSREASASMSFHHVPGNRQLQTPPLRTVREAVECSFPIDKRRIRVQQIERGKRNVESTG